ncbi:hypothetical protein KQX64_07110 [Rhodopseudomonas palustris]|nr:hypothetical protein KQX64_07110 [Rhodopseudomonas palustris]
MAILVTSGRAALAAALKARAIHFAWGRGEPWWNTTGEVTAPFAGSPQSITLPHAPVAGVEVASSDGSIVYASPADYTWDALSGRITRVITGSIPAGATVKVTATYGRPDPGSGATALLDEVGRRVANSVEHVVPDENGLLQTADGNRWTISPVPTRHLYLSVLFEFAEAADQVIREMGIFINTVRAPGLPAALPYLAPGDILDPGTAFLIDRFAPIIRSPATRQGFTFVVTL